MAYFISFTGQYYEGIRVDASDTEIPLRRPSGFTSWNGTAWVEDIGAARADASSAIDAQSGKTREKYVTSAPGQDMTYIMKGQQADAFKSAGYAGLIPAFVQAKMTSNGLTAQQATDLIIATRDQWVLLGAAIEQAREFGKAAVSASATVADVLTAKANALAALRAI